MSGEGLELNLNSPPHNKGEGGRRCEDRISELPDDIIVSILSSLPLKNAGATSLASRRWKHLWTYTCNLVFRYHTNTFEMRSGRRALKNIRWVNSALRSHRALYLKQFTISFYLPPVPQIRQPLAEWLHFAFSKRVESLKLEIRNSPFFIDHDIVFPLFNQTKTSTAVVVVCLRELKLRCDAISGEAIELFLCNCPLLERLTVDANLTSDVVVVGGSLKYLGITSENRGKSVKVVSAPNLTRLKCKFNLMLLLFLDENVPDLVEASFCISGPQDTLRRFANTAANLEILTIFLDDSKATSYVGNAFAVPAMPKLKKLALHYTSWDHTKFLQPAIRLLQASPCVEEFKLMIKGNPCDDDPDEAVGIFDEVGNDDPEDYPGAVGIHVSLNVFEFWGFCEGRCVGYHMKMVSYIVDTCVSIKEIIIVPEFSLSYPSRLYPSRKQQLSDFGNMSNVNTHTEQLLTSKVPHHIKLRVSL